MHRQPFKILAKQSQSKTSHGSSILDFTKKLSDWRMRKKDWWSTWRGIWCQLFILGGFQVNPAPAMTLSCFHGTFSFNLTVTSVVFAVKSLQVTVTFPLKLRWHLTLEQWNVSYDSEHSKHVKHCTRSPTFVTPRHNSKCCCSVHHHFCVRQEFKLGQVSWLTKKPLEYDETI